MGFYKQDDGLKYNLERRRIDGHKKQFPYETVNYVDRYRTIEEKMNNDFIQTLF